MKKTQTYELNQWDADDRILREDFNADNTKIDAALDAGCRMIKLREVVTAQTAHQVDLDISDIDWSRWQEVILDISSSEYKYFSLFFYRNNTLSGSHYTPGFLDSSTGLFGASGVPASVKIRTRFQVFRNPSQPIASVTSLGSSTHFGYYAGETFSSGFSTGKLSLCGYDSNHDVPAGTKFEFFGVSA